MADADIPIDTDFPDCPDFTIDEKSAAWDWLKKLVLSGTKNSTRAQCALAEWSALFKALLDISRAADTVPASELRRMALATLIHPQEPAEVLQPFKADNYLVLCRAHSNGGYALWWRPNGEGYTNDLVQAGRYTREAAEAIVRASDRGEEYWPESMVIEHTKPRQMIDMGDSASSMFQQKRNRDWLLSLEKMVAWYSGNEEECLQRADDA